MIFPHQIPSGNGQEVLNMTIKSSSKLFFQHGDFPVRYVSLQEASPIVSLVGGLTILKNISQWEGLSHILWKIRNVPNHQPVSVVLNLWNSIPSRADWSSKHSLPGFAEASPWPRNHQNLRTYIGLSINGGTPKWLKMDGLSWKFHGKFLWTWMI